MLELLSGDDEFKKQHKLKEILSRLAPGGNLKSIENPNSTELIRFLSGPASLFNFKETQANIYLIKDFYLLKQKEDKDDEEKLNSLCIETIKACSNDNLLVFINDSIRGTLKVVKELKKLQNCTQTELNKFKSWDTVPCKAYLKDLLQSDSAIKISDNDLEKFILYRGPESLAEIFQELETLSKSFSEIDFELLQKYSLPKYDIFSFADFLALEKKTDALKELRKIKADPEQKNNLGLLSLLHNQINLYKNIKLLESHKFNNDQIAEKLGIKSGRVYHLKLNSQNIKLNRLEKLSEQLLNYEKKIKKGEIKLLDALNLLIHSPADQHALV